MTQLLENLSRFITLFLMIGLGVAALADEPKQIVKPNCEIKLVREAGAGSMMLTFDAPSKEECLKNSEPGVEAAFKGQLQPRRPGSGPKE